MKNTTEKNKDKPTQKEPTEEEVIQLSAEQIKTIKVVLDSFLSSFHVSLRRENPEDKITIRQAYNMVHNHKIDSIKNMMKVLNSNEKDVKKQKDDTMKT